MLKNKFLLLSLLVAGAGCTHLGAVGDFDADSGLGDEPENQSKAGDDDGDLNAEHENGDDTGDDSSGTGDEANQASGTKTGQQTTRNATDGALTQGSVTIDPTTGDITLPEGTLMTAEELQTVRSFQSQLRTAQQNIEYNLRLMENDPENDDRSKSASRAIWRQEQKIKETLANLDKQAKQIQQRVQVAKIIDTINVDIALEKNASSLRDKLKAFMGKAKDFFNGLFRKDSSKGAEPMKLDDVKITGMKSDLAALNKKLRAVCMDPAKCSMALSDSEGSIAPIADFIKECADYVKANNKSTDPIIKNNLTNIRSLVRSFKRADYFNLICKGGLCDLAEAPQAKLKPSSKPSGTSKAFQKAVVQRKTGVKQKTIDQFFGTGAE